MSRREPEGLGTLNEEAVKLLDVLKGWAMKSGGDYADLTSSVAGGAASVAHQVDEHIATGGAECTYCPVCRVISTVRDIDPEVKEHLATAATSLMHAVAGLLSTQVPDPTPRREETSVGKADLDEDDEREDG